MRKLALALALAFSALTVASASASSTIVVKAKNFEFMPNVVTLHVGKPQKITFVALQGVHGMIAPEIGITKVITITSKPTTVTVTPKKIGTFPAHCAIYCGIGHAHMMMTFKVIK